MEKGKASKRDIAIILFRLLSIYSFVVGLSFVSSNFDRLISKQEGDTIKFLLQLLGPSILMILSGVLLWKISPQLASRLSKDLSDEEGLGFSMREMQEVAFSVIGVYIIIDSFSILVYRIIYYYSIMRLPSAESPFKIWEINLYLMSLAMKVILGIILIVGSSRLVKMIHAMHRD